jgi:Kef-type K+ transport system membrane component KefB
MTAGIIIAVSIFTILFLWVIIFLIKELIRQYKEEKELENEK